MKATEEKNPELLSRRCEERREDRLKYIFGIPLPE